MATSTEKIKPLLSPKLANTRLGRGPTLNHRRLELTRVLREQPGLSDRAIAAWVGCGRELVAKTRERLMRRGRIQEPEKRVGLDGKKYRIGEGT